MIADYSVLVFSMLLFTAIGVIFIFAHLMAGMLFRPIKPDAEKATIYECGEPTIGSAWIQFDLRFYVVALLFVIFDVEVAFFFPWAVVFGTSVTLAQELAKPDNLTNEDYEAYAAAQQLPPAKRAEALDKIPAEKRQAIEWRLGRSQALVTPGSESLIPRDRAPAMHAVSADTARSLAWIAFWDIIVFFGVLLVGFAYLWRRGDLDWVRSIAAEQTVPLTPSTRPAEEALAGTVG
jgi:NADH-quinone oxidoreductase subunit A